jgi:hypothetical protein
MIIKGEYLFKSFEEALEYIKAPTNYEQERNITTLSTDIMFNEADFKVVSMKKSDQTDTLFIFFKNSMKYDIWKFWCPSEKQAIMLGAFHNIYNLVDYKNKKQKLEG